MSLWNEKFKKNTHKCVNLTKLQQNQVHLPQTFGRILKYSYHLFIIYITVF